jgi:hypothetical protein
LRQVLARCDEQALLVDPWNALGTGQVFVYAAEAAALVGESVQIARGESR